MKFGLEILLHLGLQARLESRFQDARLVLIVLILNRLRQLTVYISPQVCICPISMLLKSVLKGEVIINYKSFYELQVTNLEF